jgi:peptidoglycan hydrolase-like protein with peptidoglycan-binding domain
MATWKFTTAAALASLVFAGPAFAQATTGHPATGAETKGEQPKESGAMHGGRKGGGMTMTGDEKVKAAQQALKDKGHDPGGIDGRMGRKTQAALRDFQKAQGLEATGRLDAKTMQALGMEGEKTSGTGASTGSASGGSASPTTSDMSKDAGKNAS